MCRGCFGFPFPQICSELLKSDAFAAGNDQNCLHLKPRTPTDASKKDVIFVFFAFLCLSKLQNLYIRKEHQGLFHKLALPVPWCLLKQTLGRGAENPEPNRQSKGHQATCCCHCQWPNRNIRWTLLALFRARCMVIFLTVGAKHASVARCASEIDLRQPAPLAIASIATFKHSPLEVRLEAGTRGRPIVQMSNVKQNCDKYVYITY